MDCDGVADALERTKGDQRGFVRVGPGTSKRIDCVSPEIKASRRTTGTNGKARA